MGIHYYGVGVARKMNWFWQETCQGCGHSNTRDYISVFVHGHVYDVCERVYTCTCSV